MLLILHDGIYISKLFTSLIEKLDSENTVVLNLPATDFERNGIHFSPGYVKLVKRMSNYRIVNQSGFDQYFKEMGLIDFDITDFDLALNLALTIWIKNGYPLTDFYERINEKYNLKLKILPIIEPLPDVNIKVDEELITHPEFMDRKEINEIKQIIINGSKKFELNSVAKDLLKEANTVILFQLSPLSIAVLGAINIFKKIVEDFEGHIVYLLPKNLTPQDLAVLRKLAKTEETRGLLKLLKDQVDIVVFDEEDISILESIKEMDFTSYPISFKAKTKEEIDKSVRDFLNVLEAIGETS